jgi:hypothetical protein
MSLGPAVRFPATLLLSIQYLPLVVLPAVVHRNPDLTFIGLVVAVGLSASLLTEVLLRAGHRDRPAAKPIRYPRARGLWIITVTGAFATLGSAWLGAGTYQTQVGLTSRSPFAAVLTPLTPWSVFGCAFALAAWRAGRLSTKSVLLLVGFATVAQIVFVASIARTAPLMDFAFTVGAGMVLVGFLRPRWLWVGLAVAVLVWPTLYEARNTARLEVAGSAAVPVPSDLQAQDRLREDLLLQQAAVFGRLSEVDQPSVVEILRFGLIPRVLDPDRGELPSGKALSAALGGSSRSSSTFTVLGTVWSLNGGYLGVAAYVGAVSAVMTALCRRLTPTRLAMAMSLASLMVWIESVYPDNVVGTLQAVVSLAVALTLARLSGGQHVATEMRPQAYHPAASGGPAV